MFIFLISPLPILHAVFFEANDFDAQKAVAQGARDSLLEASLAGMGLWAQCPSRTTSLPSPMEEAGGTAVCTPPGRAG